MAGLDGLQGVMLELDFDSFTPIPKNKKAGTVLHIFSSMLIVIPFIGI